MMNLGYACINLTLGNEGVSTNRGMIKKTFLEKGINYASELTLSNVQALYKILEWNVANNISVFRVTSELFPWASEYKLTAMPHYNEISEILEKVQIIEASYVGRRSGEDSWKRQVAISD